MLDTSARLLRLLSILQSRPEWAGERVPPDTGTIEATDRDSCRLTIGVDSLPQLAMHLALLGHDFVVHEPAELVEELERLADRLGKAHRASTR